jgi:hypothetical protein
MSRTHGPAIASDGKTINIIVRDGSAVLPADVADMVIAAVSPRIHANNQRPGGVRYYHRDRRGRLVLPVGLLRRIHQQLERLGYQVIVRDKRLSSAKPALDMSALPTGSSCLIQDIQQAAANAVSTGLGRGRIAIRSLGAMADVITGIIHLFPVEKALVVVKNRDAARRLATKLQMQVQVPVTSNSDLVHRSGPQLHVDNAHSMIGRNVYDWGIVIIADVESARAKTVIDQVRCMDQSCVFAIVPVDCKLDAEDQLRLQMLCGPEIYRQPDDASALTTVEIVWLAATAYPAALPQDPLRRKLLYFWKNNRRDQQIADAAIAVRTQDFVRLRQHGLHETHVIRATMQRQQPPTVCVLVESPQHGRTLGKLLPGWALIRSQEAGQEDTGLPLMLDQAIVTIPSAYKQGLAFDVVIRAAGTEQSWKPAYGPHAGINGAHMLIIDIQDDVDERAQLDCERRLLDYLQRGWHVCHAAN